MKKLLKFLKGYRLSSVFAPLFKLMEALFELIIPLVVAKIIDVGIANSDTAYILKMGGIILGLGALGLGFSLACQYLAAKASLGFGSNVRSALYRHINRLSQAEMDKFGTNSLVTRLNSDVVSVQMGVAMFIRLVLRAPFIAVGAIVMAFTIDVLAGILFIVMAIVVSVLLFFIMTRSSPFYRKIQRGLDKINLLTRENLSGVRVVRAFSNEGEETEDFKEATNKLSKTSMTVGKISGLLNPLTYAIINLSVIFVLYIGSKFVNTGSMAAGQIVALVNYLSQIMLALVVTANLAVTFTKASASGQRIAEVLELSPTVFNAENAITMLKEKDAILQFKNICFAYSQDKNMLKDISFSLNKGETLGIIGSTGSGKSTLVNLLPRFYDAKDGDILIYGESIKNISLTALRKFIGLVPQRASLFSGTLRDNLKMSDIHLTDEELIKALKTAEGSDILNKLNGGLDGEISQNGQNLSGGQKQRLTIARALAKNPQILVLDDSSSALDYATDYKLRKNLKKLDITAIIVSQRESSIRHADKILVLDDGQAVGLGTHDELIKSCPIYAEICQSQTQKAEV